jgi:hypothetical protein
MFTKKTLTLAEYSNMYRNFTKPHETILYNNIILFLYIKQGIYNSIIAKLHELQRRILLSYLNFSVCILTIYLYLEDLKNRSNELIKLINFKVFCIFQCKLTLFFQASANLFLTRNLYNLNIHDPILVAIQSKTNTFGGFSHNM